MRALAAATVALLAAAPAASGAEPLAATGPLRLELPLLDVPYDVAYGYRAPSMAQATAVARDLHTATSWAIDLGVEAGCRGRSCERSAGERWAAEWIAQLLVTAVAVQLPLYTGWAHEEYHRAVLGQYGIDSHDDINDLNPTLQSVYVSHVRDEDLVWLKREHPGDMVRLSAAGLEGDVELTRAIQADVFFDGVDWRRDFLTLLLVRANVVRYLWACDSSMATSAQDMHSAQEPDPMQRDVVGYDCDAWAYDVQRPDEPYEARGPHPTGVGIDRYRTPADMTARERELLVSAKRLSLLNLVDPAMFGVRWGVPGAPDGWRMTAGLAHQLASFGQAVTLDLYARGGDVRWRGAVRLYLSDHLWLPGVELERVRLARTVGAARLEVTPTVGLWLQPAHDRWDDTAVTPGAVARLRVAWLPSELLSAFAEVQAKTAGWVPGTVALGAGLEARLGVGGVL